MNPLSLLHAFTLTFGLSISHVVNAEQLVFEITGVKSNEGKIYVQLFKGEQDYREDKSLAAAITPAKVDQVTVRFDGLEPGEYALRYFHDENGDGALGKNLLGVPNEGYGFSNGAKPNFGPAKYKAIRFEINEPITTNRSSVIY